MFTLDQIQTAHSKVKSGADFPAYIRELRELGVASYETYVSDGHVEFVARDHTSLVSKPKYDALEIATAVNTEQFKTDLKTHQQGGSDYPTFCKQSASHGVNKWEVDLAKMSCTYFDAGGVIILVENIPG